MADTNIGSLPKIENLLDDAMLVVEQQGHAGSISGRKLKDYAYVGVSEYVQSALDAAARANEAAKEAIEAAAAIEGAADEAAAAEAAARAAAEAQAAAELAKEAAEAARDQAQAIAGGNFLPLSGGTLTGPLILPGAPTQPNGAATRGYVDDAVGSATLMKKETYDPSGVVAASGGIAQYVAAASPSEVLIVTFTRTGSGYSADHTYAEILEAYNAGKLCVGRIGYLNNNFAALRPSGSSFRFDYLYETSVGGMATLIPAYLTVLSSGAITYTSSMILISYAMKGQANGVAGLDANGKIPTNLIPNASTGTGRVPTSTNGMQTINSQSVTWSRKFDCVSCRIELSGKPMTWPIFEVQVVGLPGLGAIDALVGSINGVDINYGQASVFSTGHARIVSVAARNISGIGDCINIRLDEDNSTGTPSYVNLTLSLMYTIKS